MLGVEAKICNYVPIRTTSKEFIVLVSNILIKTNLVCH